MDLGTDFEMICFDFEKAEVYCMSCPLIHYISLCLERKDIMFGVWTECVLFSSVSNL